MQCARLLTIGLLVTALISATGCATGIPRVPPDRIGIAQLQRIGVFTWHGQPSYRQHVGYGTMGIAAGIGKTIFSAASGEWSDAIRAIWNSGLYDAYEQQLVQRLSTQLSKKIEVLNKERYVHSGSGSDRKVDTLASAKSQAYDALLEMTVWPSLDEQEGGADVSRAILRYEATLDIRVALTRVADGKLLWSASYKTWKKTRDHAPSFTTDLVPPAVDYGIKLYVSGK